MQRENRIGTPFFELSEVDSSNNYAMRQVQAHLAVHGSVWFAHYQKAGKGQRGKVWNAEHSQNIMMSAAIEPSIISVDEQFVINAAVALACYDFLIKYAVDEISIKWPNDLYWKDRKAGGILIENVVSGEILKWSIIGIGININQTLFPTALKNPVSLKQITGSTFNVIDMAKELCDHLEVRWQQTLQMSNDELMKEYCSHLYKRDEQVTFKNSNEIFTAVVRGVTRRGELLLEKNEGIVAYSSIEWL
ncbi:MAG TPA: biotin--[acetyl-CoA-carboxylase] ligase [Segetibacter sp.]|nr:biotin--[acetyl-CoA-carboxylase] ligase [Segetibacter sp.]